MYTKTQSPAGKVFLFQPWLGGQGSRGQAGSKEIQPAPSASPLLQSWSHLDLLLPPFQTGGSKENILLP